MKSSRLNVLEHLMADAMQECKLDLSRDFSTVSHRATYEGESFFTITLPMFSRHFERAVHDGRCTRSTFLGFSYPRKGALPKFLSGLLSQVFDAETGKLHPDADCAAAVFHIRQICLAFKKSSGVCPDALNAVAFTKYVATDKEVYHAACQIPAEFLRDFRQVASILFRDVYAEMQDRLCEGRLVPKHGPGNTAEHLSGNGKYYQRTWHDRLECIFPSSDYLVPSWGFAEELKEVTFLTATEEPSVRVVAVPKTHTTPRIIAIEPVCMQYAQQALLEAMVPLLEERVGHQTIRHGLLGFSDQTVNQNLALEASCKGHLATLDLSDASDRVANLLAFELFASCPLLSDAVQACRSLTADVPGHGKIELNKFASMGSAMCFVVEAMVFSTITLLAAHKVNNSRITARSVETLLSTREFRVYGDDIIVPTRYAHATMDLLTTFGLKVNQHKSFWNGKFRESCGCDAYAGYRVTPVYFRTALPTSLRDHSELLSLVDTRNQLYRAGNWCTARFLDEYLERLKAPMPIVGQQSSVKGRFSFCFEPRGSRLSRDTQTPMVRGIKVKAPIPLNPIDGFRALLKFFLKRGCEPTFDKEHLERSGRPRRVCTQVGWGPAM